MSTSGDKVRARAKVAGLAAIAITIVVARHISMKKINNMTEKDPSVGQYLNRLIEFFDSENIEKAQDEFLNMIDFGVMPQDAFGILVFSGDLN